MIAWYDLEEGERIKQVYCKFTSEDFWNWWNTNDFVMEIRIKDFELIKQVSATLSLPYSASGVYVNNATDMKRVIAFTRDKATTWFGTQPRKKNIDKYGKDRFGGKEINVFALQYLFIDIDRKVKNGFATAKDLQNCDIASNFILERFKQNGWNNNYCKICSGNGVQLLIKLDVPFIMPKITFQEMKGEYFPMENEYFGKLKKILREGIGRDIMNYIDKLGLSVDVDRTGFNLCGVGALPFTKNYKYDGFRWRGIVELVNNGPNTGLSDYIQLKEKDIKVYKKSNVLQTNKLLPEEMKIKSGKDFFTNPLVKLFLEQEFPDGGINNTLWFSLKLLIRDSGIDVNSEEFREFHNQIKIKHKRTFTLNMPGKEYEFDERVINNYCIEHMIQPVYPLVVRRKKFHNFLIDKIPFSVHQLCTNDKTLPDDTSIQEDIKEQQSMLVENNLVMNSDMVGSFTNACIKKYGYEKTKFFYQNIFYDLFTYS